MPTSCECDDIVVEDCPPYLTVETFLRYTEKNCANCTAVDVDSEAIGQIPSSSFVDAYELDRCCPVLTVYRNNQVIYSFDGGQTWIETGTAVSKATTTLGSTLFTTTVLVVPLITLANTTFTFEERSMIDINADKFRILEEGNYLLTFDLQINYVAAANTYITFELLTSGATFNPRVAQTMTFNGTNPTELSSTRWIRLTALERFSQNQDINFRIYPIGTTFTSTTTNVYMNLVKLSN